MAAEQQPVLKPKPQSSTSTSSSTSVNPVLPGGVVDVDASGGFGNPFDFSSSFGLNRPFGGFGDLFSGLNRNQWWKGWVDEFV